jgi:hypothetical protein
VLNTVHTDALTMVNHTQTKILKVGSRHTIYLEKAFVEDSTFPLKPNEPVTVKVEGKRLVIEKA